MDFVAIDFETANNCRSSACSLGMAIVRDNEIVDTRYWTIRPEPFEFAPFNVVINGITEKDVEDAPLFSDIWPEVKKIIDGTVIAAHNAPFDISVLRHTIDYYGLSAPGINFICSYRLSQIALPEIRSHRLSSVSSYLGVDLNHHCADSDAIACAEVICKILSRYKIKTIQDFYKQYDFRLGYWGGGDYYRPFRLYDRNKKSDATARDLPNNQKCIDKDFENKRYVFTGTLLSMSRNKAFEIVTRGGGFPQKNITNQTDVLVVGIQDLSRLQGACESSKMRKAREMQKNGSSINVIGEDEFIKLIDDDLYSLCFGFSKQGASS